MRFLFLLFIFSCAEKHECNNILEIENEIHSQLETIETIELDSVSVFDKQLYLSYTDTYELLQPYLLWEVSLFSLQNISKYKSCNFDSVHISISVVDKRKLNFDESYENVSFSILSRYNTSSIFSQHSLDIFKNHRKKLPVWNYLYGQVIDNKNDMFGENFFNLLFLFSEECKSNNNLYYYEQMIKIKSLLDQNPKISYEVQIEELIKNCDISRQVL